MLPARFVPLPPALFLLLRPVRLERLERLRLELLELLLIAPSPEVPEELVELEAERFTGAESASFFCCSRLLPPTTPLPLLLLLFPSWFIPNPSCIWKGAACCCCP